MDELDKKTTIECRILQQSEKSIEERFIKQENKLASIMHPDLLDEAMARFNGFVSKEVRGYVDDLGRPNRGLDRPKSYNPMMDALEGRIEPQVGVMYSVEQLKRMNINMEKSILISTKEEVEEAKNKFRYIPKKEVTDSHIEKKVSRWHKFLNWITRSGKYELKIKK